MQCSGLVDSDLALRILFLGPDPEPPQKGCVTKSLGGAQVWYPPFHLKAYNIRGTRVLVIRGSSGKPKPATLNPKP